MAQSVIGSVLRFGLTWLSRGRLPLTQGKLELPGLAGRVEVIRDRWGVPHIYAQDTHDLLMAQGLVHAQDRLWQMEPKRGTATGRLSELFGPVALDTDRAVRTFGFPRLGQSDLPVPTQSCATPCTLSSTVSTPSLRGLGIPRKSAKAARWASPSPAICTTLILLNEPDVRRDSAPYV